MTKVLIGGRRTGKTMLLVRYSAATQLPICVYTEQEGGLIKRLANELRVKIPDPVVVTRAYRNTYVGRNIEKVLVDNGVFMFESLLSRFLQLPGIKVELFAADASVIDTNPKENDPFFHPKVVTDLGSINDYPDFLSQFLGKPVENNDQNDAKID